MARPLRIEYKDAFYHVTSRGDNKNPIFKSDTDKEKFLSYLENCFLRYRSVVHCYCLMDNHYHLLLQTPLANLSEIMRYINGSYTTYFNIKRKRCGHLFQGRYKAILVEKDAYALELSRYIHLNPIRAKIVNRPGDYKWSSYAYYTKKQKPPNFLDTSLILGYFGKQNSASYKKYAKFTNDLFGKDYDSPLKNTVAQTILGDSDFVRQIKADCLDERKADRNTPALKELKTVSLSEIIDEVNTLCKDEVLARKITIYISHHYSGKKLKEIGSHFNIGQSAVSQISKRLEVQMSYNKALKKQVNEICAKLSMCNV